MVRLLIGAVAALGFIGIAGYLAYAFVTMSCPPSSPMTATCGWGMAWLTIMAGLSALVILAHILDEGR